MEKFKENAKRNGLMGKLYDKLLGNGVGKILQLFNKWRNLPLRKEPILTLDGKAINELEKKLGRLASHALKSSFDPLKETLYEGENEKKRVLKELILKTMNTQKRYWIHWSTLSKNIKNINLIKFMMNAFENLNGVAASNVSLLFQSEGTQNNQEQALKTLIRNTTNKTLETYEKWKNYVKVLKIMQSLNNETKRFLVDKLETFEENNSNAKLRNILHKFRDNMFIKRFTIKLHDKLLTTTNGKIYNGFLRWKLLPEPKDRLPLAVNDLERKLTVLAKNALKTTFDPLKNQLYDGENKQKRAAKDLIYVTMDKEKKLFMHWQMFNSNCRNIERSKTIWNSFDDLNKLFVHNFTPLLESDQNEEKKQKILLRLIENTHNKTNEIYFKWKNLMLIKRLQDSMDEKMKKHLLKKLENFLENNEKEDLRKILTKFKENAKSEFSNGQSL